MKRKLNRPSPSLARLTNTELAQTLSKFSDQKINAEMVARDIHDGAPTNPDGTVNFVHYTAWLTKHAV